VRPVRVKLRDRQLTETTAWGQHCSISSLILCIAGCFRFLFWESALIFLRRFGVSVISPSPSYPSAHDRAQPTCFG